MGHYTVTSSNHPERPSRLYVSFALVIAAALLAVAAPTMHVEVRAGGETLYVSIGTTFGELIAEGAVDLVPGDLLDVEGELLELGGGRPPLIFYNGAVTTTATVAPRLRDGDRVSSRRGGDLTEALEVTRTPIPLTVERTGKGPLVSLDDPGIIGVHETVLGAISGKVVSSRTAQEMRPMVIRRYVPEPGSRVVALTFDDGPWPGHTDAVLDILAVQEVKATFFMVGYLAERYPFTARRVVEEGHTVANHTHGHQMLTKVPIETVSHQMTEGNRSIRTVTGVEPVWFRPPAGAINPEIMREAERLGMTLVMWDVDPQDWKRPGADVILELLLAQIEPGSVVLLHDGGGDRGQTVEMLPQLITELKARGYVFLTIDELVR